MKIIKELEKVVTTLNGVDTDLQLRLKESIESDNTPLRIMIQEAIQANQSVIQRATKLKAQVSKNL
jgi:hypothetical protein